jgi:hypothetical protein
MTQTGGLVVLLAWALFGAILAVLAYFLLRPEKDPLQEIATPTADQGDSAGGAAPRTDDQAAGPAGRG